MLSPRESSIVDALLDAYRQAAFPMVDADTGRLDFFMADPRGVIPLDPPDAFHIPGSLHRRMRSAWFEIRADTAFAQVIRACAEPRAYEPKSWIDARIVRWFTLLHEAGHAHSVEAWRRDPETGRDHLVGGVYGVALGAAFCGESMFSRPRLRLPDGARHPLDGTDASKVCLVHLVRHLQRRGYTLFDAQAANHHTEQFGCLSIPADEYRRRLDAALAQNVDWGEFQP